MVVAVIHLSDLHFRENQNWLSDKVDRISGAIWSEEPSTMLYLVLVSGDIAFSGKLEEYKAARQFLDALLSSFFARSVKPDVKISIIPGNHDCDFTKGSDARQFIVENVGQRVSTFDPAGDIAAQCLNVQLNYRNFHTDLTKQPISEGVGSFASVEYIPVEGLKLRLNMLNTAWMSTIQEQQGRLYFPITCASPLLQPGQSSDLALTMLHHPFNWLENNNARALREIVEKSSDVILTGHEHVPAIYSKEGLSDNLLYLEGAILQGGEPQNKSGFSVIYVDTEAQNQKLLKFEWRSGLYSEADRVEWQPIRKNRALLSTTLQNTSDFERSLNELGTGFTHPQSKSGLSLKQIFIYPDLRRLQTAKASGLSPTVDSKQVLETVHLDKHVIISGAPLAGRSTLAKALYQDLRNIYSIKPLLLDGRLLSSVANEDTKRMIGDAIRQQYGAAAIERYSQMPSSQKAVIVDDFEGCGLNSTGRSLVIGQLKSSFDSVVLLVDEFSTLTSTVVAPEDDRVKDADFEMYEIREFGYYLRGKLVEKWVGIGREYSLTNAELIAEAERVERLITAILGRNLLPSNPITVLTILQASETAKSHDPTAGSYGYLYETLIFHALNAANFEPAQIDMVMTFMSIVAARMLESDQTILDAVYLERLAGEYTREYGMSLPKDFLERLQAARLISERSGGYGFRYPYCYYFFSARYLRDAIQGGEPADVRKRISEMVEHVHYEPFAQILTFYVYLTKDVATIKLIVNSAKQVFEEYSPCDFDEDVGFINKLYKGQFQPVMLPTSSVSENRDSYRRELDAPGESGSAGSLKSDFEKVEEKIKYGPTLPIVVKATMAMRLLQILGQIVRNSPGSLKADIKKEVTSEAYLLGLRFLNAYLQTQRESYQLLHHYFVEFLKEYRAIHRKPELLSGDLSKQADEAIIRLSEALGFAVIRRISHAVGLKDLRDIYADVLTAHDRSVPIRLVDLAIKLDVFDSPPIADAKSLGKDLFGNFYSHNVFGDLVKTYLYLREVKPEPRGELAKLLKINVDPKKRLLNPNRRK
jgi:hypothetical protein